MSSEENRKSKYFLQQEAKHQKEEERRKKSLAKSDAKLRKELEKEDRRRKKEEKTLHKFDEKKPADKPKKIEEKSFQNISNFDKQTEIISEKKEKEKNIKSKKSAVDNKKPDKEKPKVEKPKVEKPKVEKPKVEKPKVEKPKEELQKGKKEKEEKLKEKKPKGKKEKEEKLVVEKGIKERQKKKKNMKKELESQTLKGKSPNVPSETIYSSQFSFECNLKNIQSNFLDSMKAKFLITNNSSHRLEDRVLYKIYIETHDKMCYLLKIGLKPFKKELKLSTSHRFSRTIPPSSSVRYRIMLYSHRKVIANFYTQSFTISDSSAEKQIKFLGIELFSNVIIPNNPLVFWIKYNVKPIPENRTLEVHASLYDKNLILKEKPYEFKIDSSYGTELEEFRYPFSLNIPDFTAENEKLTLNISIQDIKSQNILYTKEVQLKGYSSLKGMYFQHVGYKRDIKVGETAYMVADLINKTPYRVKGNAYFFFLTESCEKKFAFRRKFKIRPGNYDKISEDITLTPELGGKKFWVLCQVKMKSKIGPILLEGKSDQYYPKIQNNPEFTVNLRASIHKDGVYFNDKIPVGIDTRIKSRYDLRNVTCEIIQNFENIEKKVIFSFKIKDLEASHSSFHWKVPSSYGTCTLEARIKVQGIDVVSANINQTPLKFDLYPEPKS